VTSRDPEAIELLRHDAAARAGEGRPGNSIPARRITFGPATEDASTMTRARSLLVEDFAKIEAAHGTRFVATATCPITREVLGPREG